MYAPAFNDTRHLLKDRLADLLTVLEDMVDRGVGDLIADNCACHVLQNLVRSVVVSAGKVEIPVRFERVLSIDSPLDHRRYFQALHLLGDLLGLDFDFDEGRLERSDLVPGTSEAAEADSGVLSFAIAHDDDPLVGVALDAK